jgi:hypothetical protein
MERLGVGDPSVEPHAVHLCERIVEAGSVVLRTLSGTRAGEVATQRWLSSPRVTTAAIVRRRVFASGLHLSGGEGKRARPQPLCPRRLNNLKLKKVPKEIQDLGF